jgi:hypothetical protein
MQNVRQTVILNSGAAYRSFDLIILCARVTSSAIAADVAVFGAAANIFANGRLFTRFIKIFSPISHLYLR